jgi:hypothetical protein
VNPLRQCSDFCSDPTSIRPHPDTPSHNLADWLTAAFSAYDLILLRLRKLARLTWAQEVWSSNLHAPTTRQSARNLPSRNHSLTSVLPITYNQQGWCNWEAGENPARPRHCERGELERSKPLVYPGRQLEIVDARVRRPANRPQLIESASKGEPIGDVSAPTQLKLA